MNKKVLVAWSGGLDSTYLVEHYALHGYDVDIVVCELLNIPPGQLKRERLARKKLLPLLKKRYENINVISAIQITAKGDQFRGLYFQQVTNWINALLCSLNSTHQEVAIGYVMNDDAVSYLDVFKGIWESYREIVNFPLPVLSFPLSKVNKRSILVGLSHEFIEHVTWCESVEDEDRCGVCPSCKRMEGLIKMNTPDVTAKSKKRKVPKLG